MSWPDLLDSHKVFPPILEGSVYCWCPQGFWQPKWGLGKPQGGPPGQILLHLKENLIKLKSAC